ncbi:MAG: hypothetical protein ACK4GT_22445, partial [Pararhodobacter sp.]
DLPRPELWTRAAAFLAVLRRLITLSGPDRFAAIAAEARWRLAAATALVRRYIHILAADIVLPPPAPARPVQETAAPSAAPRRYRETPFRFIEEARFAASQSCGPSEPDPPEFQWALAAEAVRRLVAVMANPRPHALRLARFLRQRITAVLRALPVPHHILRCLPPEIDALLCRFDQAARPEAWAGLDTS